MTQSPLPPEIRFLPIPDRIILVEQIWDSIAEDGKQFELTEEQKAELDARLAARGQSPQPSASWEEVKGRILGDK
jgi:putative addiction module component (TIGR02574 family)